MLRGPDYIMRAEALCRVLRSYRALAGMTQTDLAEQLGIPQTTVSKIESRERRLDVIEMENYLAPLGRTLTDLAADLDRKAGYTAPARTLTLVAASAGGTSTDEVEAAVSMAAKSVGVKVDSREVVSSLKAVNGRATWLIEFGRVPGTAQEAIEKALRFDSSWDVL